MTGKVLSRLRIADTEIAGRRRDRSYDKATILIASVQRIEMLEAIGEAELRRGGA